MALDDDLRSHGFTRNFSERHIAALAALASEVTFPEDELILADGQRSKNLYLVLSGSVSVELHTPRFTVSVQAVGAGQVFGWSALLDDQETLFQVRARERTTVLRLDGAALNRACQADTVLGYEVLRQALKVVAGRMRATEERFAEMCGVRV